MVTVQKKCCKHSNWYITFNEAFIRNRLHYDNKARKTPNLCYSLFCRKTIKVIIICILKNKNIKFKIIESLMTICIECFDYWEDI